jgi:hypothetical protein
MALANPQVDYVAELRSLRELFASAAPQARLTTIYARLRANETGPARLVTMVSAVEALARSLAMRACASPKAVTPEVYARYRHRKPVPLVEEVLRAHHHPDPSAYFARDTWTLFRHAVEFRNLIVHECTYLGQDKSPSLIEAAQAFASSGGVRTAASASAPGTPP